MASQDATTGKPGTPHRPMSLHGLQSIGRAGGVVAAHLAVQRTDGEAVALEQPDQHDLDRREPSHRRAVPHRAPARASAASSCFARVVLSADCDAGRARTTTRDPWGNPSTRSRIRWRSCRLTRLRCTAEPTALLTTKPTDVCPPVRGTLVPVTLVPITTCVTRVGCAPLAPRRIVCRKSSPLRMRWLRASNGSGRQLGATLAPTIGEDRAAGAGAHAQTEAVLLGATTVVGLEGALAHDCSSDLGLGRSTATARPRPDTVMGMRQKSLRDDHTTVRGCRWPVKPTSLRLCPHDVQTTRRGAPRVWGQVACTAPATLLASPRYRLFHKLPRTLEF